MLIKLSLSTLKIIAQRQVEKRRPHSVENADRQEPFLFYSVEPRDNEPLYSEDSSIDKERYSSVQK